MATLVLGTIGGLIGGGIGRAVGAVAGYALDSILLAPRAREGPRLGDLAIQTSQYGAPIPKLFGAVRVAGSVIWATDLRETRNTVSNGKGRPKTNTYSYSASFAVSLSARPISRVGRIWADGNLLRGAAGDFKIQTGFRFYTGTQDQPVDPLIAAVEGSASTPAYRGLAYAVFEDLQLGDFGNRIPSLSFEVFADDNAVSVGVIVAELTQGRVAATAPSLVDGFAATGESARAVVDVLNAAVPLSFVDDGQTLRLREGGTPVIAIDPEALGSDISQNARVRLPIERRSVQTVPETLSIAYNDGERDYQPGLQSARRDGGARRGARLDLPATLSATAARAFAETRLSSLWAERVRAKVRLPFRYLFVRPGDWLTLPGLGQTWRVTSVTLESMIVILDLLPVGGRGSEVAAEPGRPVLQSDTVHGPTTILLLDLPPLGDAAPVQALLGVVAGGVSPGWRRAALLASTDGGTSFLSAGVTAAPAIIGSALTVLAPGSAALVDRVNHVDVQLLNDAMILSDADDAVLLGGANLAMVGAEAMQFARAVPLGGARWRLSGLLRGRRGSEFAINMHGAGDAFALIDAASFVLLDPVFAQNGVSVMAVGIDDGASPPIINAGSIGASLRPLSPVHPRVSRIGEDLIINWIRRSREGWRWPDDVDAPLAEEREQYRVTITPGTGTPRLAEVNAAQFVYSAADRMTDLASGATTVVLAVSQIGARGVSVPLTTAFSLV